MRDLLSVPAMRPPGSPRTGVPGRLHREAAGERPPRARPQRRGSPGPIPNPAVKPAFAESTAAQGCGRAGRRARGGRFSTCTCAPHAPHAPHAPRRPAGGSPLRAFSRLGEVAASLAARSALRCIRPPPGIVGRAGTAGGSPPVGLSVFRGRSLPEDLREDFLLDRSCARHVLEDLRGLPAGLLALTWTSNLTEAARPALSRRSAVSKGLRLGCPPL